MGLVTAHVYVAVALLFIFLFSIRPLPTATSVSATVMLRVAPSGSSLWWSLQGYHTLAPNPWQATLIHGRPFSSLDQIQPPSHGGRFASLGVPSKLTLMVSVLPAVSIDGKLT